MNHPELYLADHRYALCVRLLADALRRPVDDERYDRVHVALRGHGIDMGEAVLVEGVVRPSLRAELVDALVCVVPDPITGLDDDQVKWTLGEHNIWPEHIREDARA